MSTALSAPVADDSADATPDIAPEAVGPEQNGEIPLRFPVLVIEAADTSDGRFLEAGSLTHRALPIPLLAQPESAHGGDDAGPAGVVGRIDTLTRTPGPEVVSPRSGEPFPDGTFVWSATGVLSSTARVGEFDVADLFRRRFLRGVSVDLAGMDYEVIGGEDGMAADPEFPRRQMIAHAAEIAAATLVVVPAFSDAYAEIATDDTPAENMPADMPAVDPTELGLAASAFPAWRSAEVGDYPALVAAGDHGTWPAGIPADAADQLARVIDDDQAGQRDAAELATAVVDHIRAQWASGDDDSETPTDEETVMAAAPPDLDEDAPQEVGVPDAPQPCWSTDDGEHPAVRSLLHDDGEQFVPTCQEHEEEARGMITGEGDEVSRVVEIREPDRLDDEETP